MMLGTINVVELALLINLFTNQANSFANHGGGTFDPYLNGERYCRSKPASVWHYRLDAYQNFQKGGSCRSRCTLRRSLRPEPLQHVTDIAQRTKTIAPSTFVSSPQQHSHFR